MKILVLSFSKEMFKRIKRQQKTSAKCIFIALRVDTTSYKNMKYNILKKSGLYQYGSERRLNTV